MALGLEIANWLREHISAGAFVASYRGAKLTHALESPEDELAMLQRGQRIEMSHQHQHNHDNDYHLEPSTRGIKSKALKPKKSSKASRKNLDDLAVETTSEDLAGKLKEVRKERSKQEDKLAYARLYNGYNEGDLIELLERAKKREKKKAKELEEYDEARSHTPEKIEASIAERGAQIEAWSTIFATVKSGGGDTSKIKQILIQAQKEQYAEQHALREARGEIYSDPSDSRAEIADKLAEARERIFLAEAALKNLREEKQFIRELGEDPSEMLSTGNTYPSKLPVHVARLARGATKHVEQMITGEDPETGNVAAANRGYKVAHQDVLAKRMEASAASTIRFDGNSNGPDQASSQTYKIASSPKVRTI